MNEIFRVEGTGYQVWTARSHKLSVNVVTDPSQAGTRRYYIVGELPEIKFETEISRMSDCWKIFLTDQPGRQTELYLDLIDCVEKVCVGSSVFRISKSEHALTLSVRVRLGADSMKEICSVEIYTLHNEVIITVL